MKKLFILFICVLLFTCHGHAQTPDFSKYRHSDFLETAYNYAELIYFKYDVPVEITMAVSILESGFGTSYAARVRCNYFGIAKGKKVYYNIHASFEDFGFILRKYKRYQPLFEFDGTDFRAWCIGLRECGYNNSEDYPDKLISIIKKYKLDTL